jgi:hypothetical protein
VPRLVAQFLEALELLAGRIRLGGHGASVSRSLAL